MGLKNLFKNPPPDPHIGKRSDEITPDDEVLEAWAELRVGQAIKYPAEHAISALARKARD